MKNIKMFHLNDCGYCDKARKAMKELKQEDKYKDVVVETIKAEKDSYGYDALLNTYTDMIKSGIVDPTKVTRSALQNAASIASMVITTETLVADKKEEKGCNCGAHSQDMGMY